MEEDFEKIALRDTKKAYDFLQPKFFALLDARGVDRTQEKVDLGIWTGKSGMEYSVSLRTTSKERGAAYDGEEIMFKAQNKDWRITFGSGADESVTNKLYYRMADGEMGNTMEVATYHFGETDRRSTVNVFMKFKELLEDLES